MTITKKLLLTTAFAGFCFNASAATIAKNTAKFQAMNKITGSVNVLEVAVNSQAKYEDFSIVVRKCHTTPPEETPESYAFVDIAETNQEKPENIYKGWMLSSSPALNPLEHPMYDLWLLECINTEINQDTILTPEQLAIRDELPSSQNLKGYKKNKKEDISKETVSQPTENSNPESLIDNVDTNIKFNAIEEEQKLKEQNEAIENIDININEQEEALNLLEKKQDIQESPTEVDVKIETKEVINTTQKEPISQEIKTEVKEERSQLIDFSDFDF